LLAILNVEPENVDAWMWLAFCAANRDEYSHALRQALRYEPEHARARNLTIRLARRTIFEATGRDLVAERDEFKKGGRRRAAFTAFIVVLSAAVLLAAFLAFGVDVVIEAQSTAVPTFSAAEVCEQNHTALQNAILSRCSGLQAGQACLMNPSVTTQRSDSGLGDFSLAGDRTRLEDLQQISADPYNLAGGDWGLVALDTSALSVLLIGGLEFADFDPALDSFFLITERNLRSCDATAPAGMLLQTAQQHQVTVNGVRVDFVGSA
jgi:hypothetical protein